MVVILGLSLVISTSHATNSPKGVTTKMIDAAPIASDMKSQGRGPDKVSAPKKPGAEKNDIDFYRKSGHRSKEWDEFIEPGFESFDSGSLATSYVFLRRAFDRGCRDGLVLYRLGIYSEVRGNFREAAALLVKAAEGIRRQYPNHPLAESIDEHAGRALYQANDFDRARPYLESALRHTPEGFMLLYMLGQIARMKGEFDASRNYLEKALQVPAPGDVGFDARKAVLTELIAVTYELDDLDSCEAYVDAMLAAYPQDPVATSYKERLASERQRRKEREIIERLVK